MSNNYISLSNSAYIEHELFQKLSTELIAEIKQLKPADLFESKDYERTKNQLIKNYVLVPVTFGEVEIIDHQVKTTKTKPNYQNMFGTQQEEIEIQTTIPITGSDILFKYSHGGMSYSSKFVPYIYQPIGNNITLKLTFGKMPNKKEVLDEVETHMAITRTIIQYNNEYIASWNNDLEKYITSKLDNQMMVLKELY